MKNIIKTTILISSASFLVACGGFGDDDFSTDINDVNFSSGDLDVTKYVAIGDSLTAGFADGALYIDGQENSYPNILAGNFARVGGGEFRQPLMSDNLGGLLFGGNQIQSTRLIFSRNPGFDPNGPDMRPFLPVSKDGMPTTEITSTLTGDFNNVGIPGAKVADLLSNTYATGTPVNIATGVANPYFVRFASAPNTTLISDVVLQQPSFFTLWIGNNDLLDVGSITSTASFENDYQQIISDLTATGTNNVQGALINLPRLTNDQNKPIIPYFTLVPFNAVTLTQVQADTANAGFATYNAAISGLVGTIGQEEVDRRTLNFVEGQNAILIEDNDSLIDLTGSGLPSLRQATADDFIPFPVAAILGTVRTGTGTAFDGQLIGVGAPLLDSEALTKDEVPDIETARQAFNAIIKAEADANSNLIYVDVASAFDDLLDDNGLSYGTGTITAEFGTGGAFSLDGLHLTAKGYAVISNLITDNLNSNFNANIPRVNPNNFTEIFFE